MGGKLHETQVKPCCDELTKHVSTLNSVIIGATLRLGYNVLGDDWEYFKYCPWCGKKF